MRWLNHRVTITTMTSGSTTTIVRRTLMDSITAMPIVARAMAPAMSTQMSASHTMSSTSSRNRLARRPGQARRGRSGAGQYRAQQIGSDPGADGVPPDRPRDHRAPQQEPARQFDSGQHGEERKGRRTRGRVVANAVEHQLEQET